MVRTEQHAIGFGNNSSPARHEDLPTFERACLAVKAERLGDPEESARLLSLWFDGVALLDPLSRAKSDVAEPRVVAAMSQLATAWLSPQFEGEPRTVARQRIPSLRPAAQSHRLRELMGKNTEGTLTPLERDEFMRLHEFFEMLQDIVDAALYRSPATS